MKESIRVMVTAIATAVAAIIQILIMGILIILSMQIFMRSVLHSPPSWTEEISILGFTWAMLLGIAYGVRDGIHVRMEIFLDILPAAIRELLNKIISIGVIGIGGFLAISGWNYMIETSDSASAAIGYPMPVLYMSAVISGGLIVIFGLESLFLINNDNEADGVKV